ncbi:MAG: Npt1/Npt2 family nucleotide transporter [Desulfobacteraceae bacterium]|jgi:ATP/ADP translocase
MLRLLGKWLKVYDDEINLFLWSALLLFLIRSSNIIFNNFAETAFLKRFGVEYLPMIFIINSISTFFIMGLITGIIARLPGYRLLSYMLVICGTTVAGLRFVVPLGFEILYPILYVLKAQYEVMLGLFFWNLANDLFNTRQSKRIFPLITAGGVMGGVIGSFGTPFLVKAISIDNLMFIYLGTTLTGAVVVRRMGTLFPSLLPAEGKRKKVKTRLSLKEEFKKVLPIIKESALVKILILLTLLPNVVIPIINYQFNYAIDEAFATEGRMIQFFGYFRGALNGVSFIILLFVGRIYGRLGLPIALMFHPFNYVIAFLGFLFKFDVFSAMYAQFSTRILRNTINNPARGVLMGLFPAEYRALIRPFLRGTVVRVGTLVGSGIIIASTGILHPRYLSLIALVFMGGWIATTFVLKRSYSRILLDLISRNMLDLKSQEEQDVSRIFLDKGVQSQLLDAFLSSKGNTCLWYANLIKSLGMKDLDAHILSIIKDQDDRTQIGLLSLLSPDAGEQAVRTLEELADPDKPDLSIAALKTAAELPPDLSTHFLRRVFDSGDNPEIKAYAVIGLYRQEPQTYRAVIDSWLASGEMAEQRAGIISAGASNSREYVPVLQGMLEKVEDESLISLVLEALHQLGTPEMDALVFPYLGHSSERVRQSALEAFNVEDDNAIRAVIPLLGDRWPGVQDLAKVKLQESPYQNAELLIESLVIPNRKLREGVFSLLESLEIKDVDVFRFARSQMERAYRNLAEAEALRPLSQGEEGALLLDHLVQKKNARLETILRVLATQDRSGRMRIVWRGIYSADSRQKSNAIEALEDLVGHSLSKTMLPLVEDLSPSECLAIGRKNFNLPDFDSNAALLYHHLLAKYDWVTVVLTLYLIGRQGFDGLDRWIVEDLARSDNSHIQQMAQSIVSDKPTHVHREEADMETSSSIPDKILRLRGIQIFEGLSVSELAAIASVTEEVVHPLGTVVITEGETGETMYMIIAGEVSVHKSQEGGTQIELDRILAGDYFGEMALFEDVVRSATIRTEEETRLLVLHKQEFTEIVREYPKIALHICRILSQRIRVLHEKIKRGEKQIEDLDATCKVEE